MLFSMKLQTLEPAKIFKIWPKTNAVRALFTKFSCVQLVGPDSFATMFRVGSLACDTYLNFSCRAAYCSEDVELFLTQEVKKTSERYGIGKLKAARTHSD